MKKKLLLFTTSILVVCLLLATMTACMKIGMRKSNVLKSLEEAGATVEYKRTTPMTKNGEKDYSFEDLIYATKAYGEGEDSETLQELYVIFCGSDDCADWAEESCKKYVDDNPDTTVKWNTYRYDRVILCGYYKLVSAVRSY